MSLNEFELIQDLGKEDNISLSKVKRKKDNLIFLLKHFELRDDNEKRNAINEIKILSNLNHPNIIEFRQSFFDKPSNSLNMLMEFPNNGNLSNKIQFVKKKEMYMEECIIWNVLTQILYGLNYIHKKGIVHRNLKSKNIFLTKSRTIKICDFNSCCILEKKQMAQTQIGTPFYTAPEIWNQKPYNYKSDIWSLGCIIYEMATLSLPFKGETIELLYENIMSKKYNPIPDFYSNNLKNLIDNMLSFDPSRRPSSDILLNYPKIKEITSELNSIYSNYKIISILQNNQNLQKSNTMKIKKNNNLSLKKIPSDNINSKENSNENLNANNLKNLINSRNSNSVNKTKSIPKSDFDKSIKEVIMKKKKPKIKINNSTYRTLRERKIYPKNSFEYKNNKLEKNLEINNLNNISDNIKINDEKSQIINNNIKIVSNHNININREENLNEYKNNIINYIKINNNIVKNIPQINNKYKTKSPNDKNKHIYMPFLMSSEKNLKFSNEENKIKKKIIKNENFKNNFNLTENYYLKNDILNPNNNNKNISNINNEGNNEEVLEKNECLNAIFKNNNHESKTAYNFNILNLNSINNNNNEFNLGSKGEKEEFNRKANNNLIRKNFIKLNEYNDCQKNNNKNIIEIPLNRNINNKISQINNNFKDKINHNYTNINEIMINENDKNKIISTNINNFGNYNSCILNYNINTKYFPNNKNPINFNDNINLKNNNIINFGNESKNMSSIITVNNFKKLQDCEDLSDIVNNNIKNNN